MIQFNWTPGIGDPTIGGWLTVVLYFTAVWSCWRTAKALKFDGAHNTRELRAWWAITFLFIALGINKQLDLQTAFTELGRVLASREGWYGQRQFVQVVFIMLVAVVCVIAAGVLLIWARRSALPTWVALIGTTSVLGFVLMRAASFHHIDRFIGSRVLLLRWNWVIEMGGIIVTLCASEWRRRQLQHAPAGQTFSG